MKPLPDEGRHYGRAFYESKAPTSRQSARVILPHVMRLLHPTSAVDVGCGIGAWLAILRESGLADVLGIDGEHVDRSLLEIPVDRFLAHDLRLPLTLNRQFDLVISLEVAEHLPRDCGTEFIDSLIGLGPAVLFSAAIPGQGGANHVNEHWQTYWVSLFEKKGYRCLDLIRPEVWDDERVDWWYRQNTFLFVHPQLLEVEPALQRGLSEKSLLPHSLVHPRLMEAMSARLELALHPPRFALAQRAARRLPDPMKRALRVVRSRLRNLRTGGHA